MVNVFTEIPRVGDAVVGELATGKVRFITSGSFSLQGLNSSDYETIGVVYKRNGRKVKIAYKENAQRVWLTKWRAKLTGYVLDGTERTGVISFRETSSSTANTDVTVSYNATELQGLVDALNSAFTANEAMASQQWKAGTDGESIFVEFSYSFWQQTSYNTAKDGFNWAASSLLGIEAVSNIRRRHGGNGGEGVVSSLERALAYYKVSTGTNIYEGNVSEPLTDVGSRAYPIALQSYLGSNCAKIREVFGDGEAGWRKSVEAFIPVCPTDYGNMGMRDGLKRTKKLAEYTDLDGNVVAEAAAYCLSKSTAAIPKGLWYLPTVEDLYDLLENIKYGTDGSRDADLINKTLAAMNGSAISNGSNLWSCCRYYSDSAWIASGYYGFFGFYSMLSRNLAIPVSLYIID